MSERRSSEDQPGDVAIRTLEYEAGVREQELSDLRSAISRSGFRYGPSLYDEPCLWCIECGRDSGYHWAECKKGIGSPRTEAGRVAVVDAQRPGEASPTCLHLDKECPSWEACAQRTAKHSAARAEFMAEDAATIAALEAKVPKKRDWLDVKLADMSTEDFEALLADHSWFSQHEGEELLRRLRDNTAGGHSDECLRTAALTRRAFCIAPCADRRRSEAASPGCRCGMNVGACPLHDEHYRPRSAEALPDEVRALATELVKSLWWEPMHGAPKHYVMRLFHALDMHDNDSELWRRPDQPRRERGSNECSESFDGSSSASGTPPSSPSPSTPRSVLTDGAPRSEAGNAQTAGADGTARSTANAKSVPTSTRLSSEPSSAEPSAAGPNAGVPEESEAAQRIVDEMMRESARSSSKAEESANEGLAFLQELFVLRDVARAAIKLDECLKDQWGEGADSYWDCPDVVVVMLRKALDAAAPFTSPAKEEK